MSVKKYITRVYNVSRIRLQNVVFDKSQMFEVTKMYIQTNIKFTKDISKLKGSQWSRLRIGSARAIILLSHNTISLSLTVTVQLRLFN
jgi:hypothetical protein